MDPYTNNTYDESAYPDNDVSKPTCQVEVTGRTDLSVGNKESLPRSTSVNHSFHAAT